MWPLSPPPIRPQTMRLYKWPATRLAFVPGIIEALYDAGLAVAVFGMPFTLALSLGFILKAVGPGLVVPAMFQLQKAGWGAVKGIPSTVVIAASFDDIIAITGFSIFSNVAIGGSSKSDTAWQIASGPLQVLFGLIGGYLAGLILGATRLWDNKYKRLVGIYGSGEPGARELCTQPLCAATVHARQVGQAQGCDLMLLGTHCSGRHSTGMHEASLQPNMHTHYLPPPPCCSVVVDVLSGVLRHAVWRRPGLPGCGPGHQLALGPWPATLGQQRG